MSCGPGCTRHHLSFNHEDRLDTWWRHQNHGCAKLACLRRYRYADLRTISNADSRAPFIVHTTVHVTTHIVMLGLAYEFSGPMPIVAKY
jgi:hypothetical protein